MTDQVSIKRFSEFAEEHKQIEGIKKRIDDVLNCEIVITDFAIKKSKFVKENAEKVLTLQFIHAEKKCILFTGSNVLIDQVEKYAKHIPFMATIKKMNNRFYTLT